MGIVGDIRNFFESSKRVLIISKKPTKEEYFTIAKITALGIIFIAFIGFIIAFLFRILCAFLNICL